MTWALLFPYFTDKKTEAWVIHTASGRTRIEILVLSSRGWFLTSVCSSCECFWNSHSPCGTWLCDITWIFSTRTPPETRTEPCTDCLALQTVSGGESYCLPGPRPPMVTWASTPSFQKILCVTGCFYPIFPGYCGAWSDIERRCCSPCRREKTNFPLPF